VLMPAVDSYLAIRRAAGFELEVPEYLLRSFARFASGRRERYIRTATVIEWAGQAPSRGQRHHRLCTVVRFARHVWVEDSHHEIPPTDVFGRKRSRRVPYIYSKEDTARLIRAASSLGPNGSLRPHTYSSLFALLFATGLRISEALALRFDDVTPDGLVIRKTKFQKSRLVPLHETASEGLSRYIRRRRQVPAMDDWIFVSVRGRRLDRSSVHETFCGLLESVGLYRGAGRRPRIHDVRHNTETSITLRESRVGGVSRANAMDWASLLRIICVARRHGRTRCAATDRGPCHAVTLWFSGRPREGRRPGSRAWEGEAAQLRRKRA
jgi:integrase/recombinase XerD